MLLHVNIQLGILVKLLQLHMCIIIKINNVVIFSFNLNHTNWTKCMGIFMKNHSKGDYKIVTYYLGIFLFTNRRIKPSQFTFTETDHIYRIIFCPELIKMT